MANTRKPTAATPAAFLRPKVVNSSLSKSKYFGLSSSPDSPAPETEPKGSVTFRSCTVSLPVKFASL